MIRHFIKSWERVRRGLFISAAIILPLMAPLFVLMSYGTSEPSVGQDFQVEVTRDGLEEDFGKFTPKKIFKVGMHIDELTDIRVSERTFGSRFVYWAKNYFDRSENDRSEVAEDGLRVVNADELEIEPKTVRKIGGDEASKFISYLSYEASGMLKNDFYLAKYPFDKHTLRFIVEPKDLTAEELLLVVDPHSTLGASTSLGLWNIDGFKAHSEIHVAKSDFSDPSTIEKGTLWTSVPRVIFEIPISRNILSHLIKELLPLLLILVMIYLNFYIQAGEFDVRIEVAFTAFLSITALHLVGSDKLPEISYLTAMDQFFLVSYALVLLTMIEAIVSQWFLPENAQSEKVVHEHPWFRFGIPALRVVFPLFLAGSWYWIAIKAFS